MIVVFDEIKGMFLCYFVFLIISFEFIFIEKLFFNVYICVLREKIFFKIKLIDIWYYNVDYFMDKLN